MLLQLQILLKTSHHFPDLCHFSPSPLKAIVEVNVGGESVWVRLSIPNKSYKFSRYNWENVVLSLVQASRLVGNHTRACWSATCANQAARVHTGLAGGGRRGELGHASGRLMCTCAVWFVQVAGQHARKRVPAGSHKLSCMWTPASHLHGQIPNRLPPRSGSWPGGWGPLYYRLMLNSLLAFCPQRSGFSVIL